MATTSVSAGHHKEDGSSKEPDPSLPKFGMNKGVRIQAGHILFQGKYIDQNQFYRVSHLFSIELCTLSYLFF